MLISFGRRCSIIIFLYVQQALCLPLGNNSQSTYDQRQTGKYNIHISLKDVAIIEVNKNEYIDDTINNADEYYYDEDDLTIKPIPTWMISTTTTIKSHTSVGNFTEEFIDSQLELNKQEDSMIKSLQNINATNTVALNTSLNLNLNSSFYPLSTDNSTANDTDLQLPMKPVFHNQKTKQGNIQKKRIQHTNSLTDNVPNKFHGEEEINSTILKIISAKPLPIKRLAVGICKSNNMVGDNGNCKKRRPSVLKSVFDMLKLIQVKD